MKSAISYADFEKLDFRVGEVISADESLWSNKLLRLEVEFGDEMDDGANLVPVGKKIEVGAVVR